MDELLQALHRRWLASPGDTRASQAFLQAYTRTKIAPRGPNPLDEIVLDLLVSHMDDEGVNSFTSNATNKLLSMLYGNEAAARYRRLVEMGGENRSWLKYQDLDPFIVSISLRCGHKPGCDESDPKCGIVRCLCPGCSSVEYIISETADSGYRLAAETLDGIDICYHHQELLYVYGPESFLEMFEILTRF